VREEKVKASEDVKGGLLIQPGPRETGGRDRADRMTEANGERPVTGVSVKTKTEKKTNTGSGLFLGEGLTTRKLDPREDTKKKQKSSVGGEASRYMK